MKQKNTKQFWGNVNLVFTQRIGWGSLMRTAWRLGQSREVTDSDRFSILSCNDVLKGDLQGRELDFAGATANVTQMIRK